ncbi:MAG TPA: hypothetical protein VKD72_01390 [Gemmataceae bacterium]|nr:hypothetical protein [Gemmataceae bacterium]
MLDKPVQGGLSVAEAVILSGPKGNSYSLTAAQAVAAQGGGPDPAHGASNYDEFNSTFGEYHGIANITARAVAGSKTNMDAYLRQLSEVVESEVTAFTSVGARKLLGPVGGSIGQVTNVATNGVAGAYTLAKAADAYNFAAGMICNAASTDGSAAPANVRGTTTVSLGFVTQVFPDGDNATAPGAQVFFSNASGGATSNWLAGSGGTTQPINNDFLFRHGDIQQATDLSDAQIRSFQSWITLVAATGTFNQVNRSQDARLSGFRVPATQMSGMSILDRIQLLATVGRSQNGAINATLCVVGPRTWQQLATEAQSYGTLQFTRDTKIGVEMLTIITANGPTMVMNEPHCVESDIWLFTRNTLKLYNYDGFPALDEGDGNELLRQNAAAGYEVRWHAFTCATVNGKPMWNGRCDSGNV